MIKTNFLHLQLLVFGLGFYYWICFVSFWKGGDTGEHITRCLNTDKCNHFIHSGIPGKALIPIYQESRDSGPNPSLVPTSLNSHWVTLWMNLMHSSWHIGVTCLCFEGMIHSNSMCKSHTVTLRAWQSLQNSYCAAVTQMNMLKHCCCKTWQNVMVNPVWQRGQWFY